MMRSSLPPLPSTTLATPTLHRNSLIAALQLLSWLLFRPSAWHQQIRRIAPGLSPNFTLLELSRDQWRNPTLRRLLRLIYLLWPVLVTLLVALILGSMGKTTSEIVFGALLALMVGLSTGLVTGMLLSVAAGLVGVIASGLALGIAGGLVGVLLNLGPDEVVMRGSMGSIAYRIQPTVVSQNVDTMAAYSPLATPQAVALMEAIDSASAAPAAESTVAGAPPVEQAAAAPASDSIISTAIPTGAAPRAPEVIAAEQAATPTRTVVMQNSSSNQSPTPLATLVISAEGGNEAVQDIVVHTIVITATMSVTRWQFASPLRDPAFTPITVTLLLSDGVNQAQSIALAENSPQLAATSVTYAYVAPSTPTPTSIPTSLFTFAAEVITVTTPDAESALVTGAFGFIVIGMIVAMAAVIATDARPRQDRRSLYSWRALVGGIAIGLLVSAIVVLLAIGAARALAMRQVTPERVMVMVSLFGGIAQGALFALAVGWRTRRWGLGWGLGLLLAILVFLLRRAMIPAVTSVLVANADPTLMRGINALLLGPIMGILFTVIIALPYLIVERLAGAWAGGIAGALGGGGSVVAFMLLMAGRPLWPVLPLSLLCLALGLALPLWWPLLRYPIVAGWSALLLHLDQQRGETTPSLLPYHPAFWDELQPLPLPGLDEHLVLAVERTEAEGQVAMALLSTGHQRWAAQAAQIELDARQLEACQSVRDIPVACSQVVAGELSNAASALLRAFGRIGVDVEAALAQENFYNQRLALSAVEERLDGLLRELTRSDERYANRFRPIAEKWWEIIHTEVATLTAAAEARQEIESPYIIGVPLSAQQEIFVGRADICERIEQLLRDQRHPPLLLYGQRRMGKTSLLNNLGRLLPSTIVPLFVDLQGPVALAGDHAGFLYNLARTMSDSARRQRDLLLPPLARAELATDPFTRFDEWLDEVEHTLGDATALLALDEFEVLDSAFATGRLNAEAVLGSLRHWVQHRPRFKILLTGSHVVEELSSWANYLINVQVVHIGYLQEEETRRLVERPVKAFALSYEPAASRRVWELTRGHPALTQLLCYEIVALKNQQEPTIRRLATLTDVEAAAQEALERGALFFHEIETGQLTPAARTLLRWLASQGEGSVVTIERAQAAYPLEFATEFTTAIKLLLRRELIVYANGGYRVPVELIRRWFGEVH